MRAKTRDRAVSIATGYGLDDQGVGVRFPVEAKNFTSPCRPDRLWAHPASYPMRTGGFLLGVKRQGREADLWHKTNAEVKKACIYTSTSPYIFMAYCLIS
jgi:hypothetical protein